MSIYCVLLFLQIARMNISVILMVTTRSLATCYNTTDVFPSWN